MQETWVWSLGWEDTLKKEMATHSSILTWRIPWTEKPGGLQSHGVIKSWNWLSNFHQTFKLLYRCESERHSVVSGSFFFSLYLNFFIFIFKLYNIVLVLPNIEMNPPQVYPRSPSWTLLPPPSPTLTLGRPSAPAPSIQYRASNLDWWLVSYTILYMFQCYSPKSPHPLPLPQSP